jgi:hypothetical protein
MMTDEPKIEPGREYGHNPIPPQAHEMTVVQPDETRGDNPIPPPQPPKPAKK